MRRWRIFPTLLLLLLLASILNVPNHTSAGALPVVRNLNTGEIFSSINDAISDPDTKPGHVILLDSGKYVESVTVEKAVVIRSASGNPKDVIVETPEPGMPVFRIKVSGAVIKALTITGVKKTGMYAVVIESGTKGCKVLGTRIVSSYGGIYIGDKGAKHVVSENYFESVAVPVMVYQTSGVEVSFNTIQRPERGVFLSSTVKSIILNNTITKPLYAGIHLKDSSNDNLIAENKIAGGGDGVVIQSSEDNWIENNTITGGEMGISVFGDRNIVRGNVITNNSVGIYSADTFGNLFYNNYLSNVQNAIDLGKNYWNTTKKSGRNIVGGYYIGGNYWSDYYGKDTDEDGIGDTKVPHTSGGNLKNGDWLPLVLPKPASGPDLRVTDIWREGSRVYFQVINSGDEASGKFRVALMINGEPVKEAFFERLKPGERKESSFELSECPWLTFTIGIWADSRNDVKELEEDNNIREEKWKCDEKAPRIRNISLKDIGGDYAEVMVITNEPTRVKIKYGSDSMDFEETVEDGVLSMKHHLKIKGLKPSTLYRYIVTVTDRSNNTASSREMFFETKSLPDGSKPKLGKMSITGSGNYYEIKVPVSDESGISRVEFYVDGELVGVHYRPTGLAGISFNPSAFGMSGSSFFRDHEITVKVCDMTGVCEIGSELWRPEYEVHSVNVEITSPPDHYSLKAGQDGVPSGTTLDIEVYAAEYELGIRDCLSSELGQLACMNNPSELIPHAIGEVTLYIWGPGDYNVSETFRPRTDDELSFTYTWDMSGLPVGLYLIAAVANSTDGNVHFSRAITVEVQEMEEDYSLDIRTVRHGNYFNVTLRVHNTGDVPIDLKRITQRLKGFQPVESDGSNYNMESLFDSETEVATVYLDFDSVTLQPGERLEVSYLAVPVMYPHPIYVCMGCGGITVETESSMKRFYRGYYAMVLENGVWRVEDIAEARRNAIRESDYLIVTDPSNLYVLNNKESVHNLLSVMAELAVYRNGIIGYVDFSGSIRMRDRNPRLVSTGDTNGDGSREVVAYYAKIVRDGSPFNITYGMRTYEPIQKFGPSLLNIGPAKSMALVDFDKDGKDEVILVFENRTVAIYGRNTITDKRGNPREEYVKEFELSGIPPVEKGLDCGFPYAGVLEEYDYPVCLYPTNGGIMEFGYNPVSGGMGWTIHPLPIPGDSILFMGEAYPGEPEEVIILRPNGTLEFYELTVGGEINLLGSVQTSYQQGDDVDWGDVDGDSIGELVVFKKGTGTVELYDTNGLRETHLFFYSGKAMLEDIIGGSEDEVVVINGENFEFLTWNELKEGSVFSTTLIKRWGQMMKPGWLSKGYLLIVGETEIVPAQQMSFDPLWLEGGDVMHVRVTDLPYANTEGDVLDPELMVGRIVGDTASDLEIAVRNAIRHLRGECSFDRSHALILSGWSECRGGGCADQDFGERSRSVKRALEKQGTEVTIIYTTDYPDVKEGDRIVVNGRRLAVEAFFNNTPEKDIIHLEGHGNTNVIDDIYASDVSSRRNPFGNTCPLVYAESCLTGDYTKGKSMAEAFLQAGAVVYLGSTESTYSAPWTARAKRLYNRWESGMSIGEALRKLKRDMGIGMAWELEDDMDMLWVISMHLYGDPKLGLGIGTPSGEPEGTPQSLELDTPTYSIQKTDEGSLIELEDGGVLLLPGQSPIPYYTYSIRIPKGTRVQNVELTEREVLETLDIEMVPFRVGKLGEEKENWTVVNFTFIPYQWRVIENFDGSSTLFIRIFPVEYNNLTKKAVVYGRHKFSISYVKTSVEISRARLDKSGYHIGERVRVAGIVTSEGEKADVVLTAVLRNGANGKAVRGLKPILLNDLTGVGRFSFEFSTENLRAGNYYVELLANDMDGNLLDRKLLHFQLGIRHVENVLTVPETPTPGKEFTAVLRVINTGDLPVKGEVHLTSGGKEIIKNVTLNPKEDVTIEGTFHAGKSGAEVKGYVLYDGKMSKPAVLRFSFASPPKARFAHSPENPNVGTEVRFMDMSSDSDGEIVSWEWDFGDGYISRKRNPTHKYQNAGTYIVRLKVVDSDGLSSETKMMITVKAKEPESEEKPTFTSPSETTTSSPEETEKIPTGAPEEGKICGTGMLLLILLACLGLRGKG
ncbi:hypothetical protein JCM16138_20540 [Thermococcus atlanticus]